MSNVAKPTVMSPAEAAATTKEAAAPVTEAPVIEQSAAEAPAATVETKEEAPVQAAPAPKVSAPAVAPVETADAALSILEDRIRAYKNVNNGFLNSDKKRDLAISLFQDIMILVISTPTQPYLNRVFKFFRADSTVILAPQMALQGITRLDGESRAKVEVFYTLFYELTRPVPGKLDLTQAGKVLKSDAIVNFVGEKLKNLQAAAKSSK